jgi:hypothetical protein
VGDLIPTSRADRRRTMRALRRAKALIDPEHLTRADAVLALVRIRNANELGRKCLLTADQVRALVWFVDRFDDATEAAVAELEAPPK